MDGILGNPGLRDRRLNRLLDALKTADHANPSFLWVVLCVFCGYETVKEIDSHKKHEEPQKLLRNSHGHRVLFHGELCSPEVDQQSGGVRHTVDGR